MQTGRFVFMNFKISATDEDATLEINGRRYDMQQLSLLLLKHDAWTQKANNICERHYIGRTGDFTIESCLLELERRLEVEALSARFDA